MKFTKELIYQNCAKRIEQRIEEKKITHAEIYPSDTKIISKIIHCKISKIRNPYLIQDAVLYEIKEKLSFESYQEILWGTKEDIEGYLLELFQSIVFDIIAKPTDELGKRMLNILCNYPPFYKYSIYFNRKLLFDYIKAYKRDNLECIINLDAETDKAIYFWFSSCYKNILNSYLRFTNNTESFKKWDSKLITWIKNDLLVIFESAQSTVNCEVRLIIERLTRMLTDIKDKEFQYVTEKYITELENLSQFKYKDIIK